MTSRRLIITAHDLATTALALFASFFLRWGAADFGARLEPIAVTCLATLPVALGAYWLMRLPHRPWKYVSVPDVGRIAAAAAIPALFLALVDFALRGPVIVPRTVPAIYWLVQVALLIGPRLAYRIYRTQKRERRAFAGQHRVPVLIAGTDHEAASLIGRLRGDAVTALDPAALLTSKPREVGETIHGVPVLGRFDELGAVMEALAARGVRPKRIVLTRAALAAEGVDTLLGSARRLGLAPVRLSDAFRDVGPDGQPLALAPVSIDDLLGRQARDLDLSAVEQLVIGGDVLVTGAGGSIGSELCRQIAAMRPRRLMLLEQSELALWGIARELRAAGHSCDLVGRLCNVQDAAEVEQVFESFRPALVFHAAALKHVDIVEAHPVAAAATNAIGTLNVARSALGRSICAVFISTDKAVDPVSVLGATKRAGELVFAAHDVRGRAAPQPTRFMSVRFGNVLGSSGSVIPLFAEQLRAGGPVTVTHPEVERYFMTISEAVRLVLMASVEGVVSHETAPVFVLDMGAPVRIVDLARRMIRLAGLEPDVDVQIAFTGLRPGERLTELLEGAGEGLRETRIPGVRVVQPRVFDDQALEQRLTRLGHAVAAHDAASVRTVLGEIVPEYCGGPEVALSPAPVAPPPTRSRPRLRLVK